MIIVGLGCSLAGDVALLFPGRFAWGLAAFLFAHLAYLSAFSLASPVQPHQAVLALPFVGTGALVVWYVWRGLGRMKIPVLVYLAVATAMAWRAASRGEAPTVPRESFLLALAGACLFIVSDGVVALRRFAGPFPGAQPVELATYWAAQTLIALSVRVTGP